MNILIPMAGEGSRFKTEGYTFPKASHWYEHASDDSKRLWKI